MLVVVLVLGLSSSVERNPYLDPRPAKAEDENDDEDETGPWRTQLTLRLAPPCRVHLNRNIWRLVRRPQNGR